MTVEVVEQTTQVLVEEDGAVVEVVQGEQLVVEIEAGPAGPTGATGPQGDTGPAGERGPAGPQGERGPTGDTGPAGPQGIQGERGPAGEQGPSGAQGIQGERGPAGDTGPAGPQGERGPAGADGNSPVVSMSGDQITVDGVITGPHLTGPQGEKGDPGEVLLASFDATVDFGRGNAVAYATIADPSMTATKVIQPFFTSNLDEVAVLGMRVTERSRTVGVGFEVIAVAPSGAFGTYTIRAIVQGA